MAEVILKNVKKLFNGQEVIKDLNLSIPSGSFTVLVGPSGCGKSTTLRMIAGLELPTAGEIWIDDEMVNKLEPGQRDIAMVFQNYALYPTMSVKQNIEFGLINRKIPKQQRKQLIDEISEIVGLTDYLNRKPSELSGGQRQRVALARAMVKKPKVFLMDEPLSNLDAQLRQQMRIELMELHKKLGTTFIYVTHDQVEAMSMGDQIVIMNQGDIQQVDSPIKVYQEPENLFVSKFIGSPPMNVFPFTSEFQHFFDTGMLNILKKDGHSRNIHYIGIRPEKIVISSPSRKTEDGLLIHGTILTQEMLGAEILYSIDSQVGRFIVRSYEVQSINYSSIQILFPYEAIEFFDHNGTRLPRIQIANRERALA